MKKEEWGVILAIIVIVACFAGLIYFSAFDREAYLPPGATVVEKQSFRWWVVSINGHRYQAQWIIGDTNRWELTPLDK